MLQCKGSCDLKHINIKTEILSLKVPDQKSSYIDKDEFTKKIFRIYEKSKKIGCNSLIRFILEYAILKFGLFDYDEAYNLFCDLYNLDGEWKTDFNKTIAMRRLFDDFLFTEIFCKIFSSMNHNIKMDLIGREDELINNYIKHCKRFIKIGKPLQDNSILEIGIKSLWALYLLYFNDVSKSFEYAKQLNDNDSYIFLCINLCKQKIIPYEKNKHFLKMW